MLLADLLKQLHIEFAESGEHHHVREGWVGIKRCPWCGSDNYHLAINAKSFACSCWRCGRHNLVATLAASKDADVNWIKSQLHNAGLQPIYDRQEPVIGKYKEPHGVGGLESVHIKYLRSRKVTDADIRLWGLRGIGAMGGNLAWRIFMPIHYEGRPAAWTTRDLGDNGLRYISSKAEDESIPHRNLLYGYDLVRYTGVVVEGPFDAIRIGPGAVATMGTEFTQKQMMKVASLPNRVICFDNNDAAQARARKLADAVAPLPGDTYIVRLDAKDAGSASDSEIRKIRKHFLE